MVSDYGPFISICILDACLLLGFGSFALHRMNTTNDFKIMLHDFGTSCIGFDRLLFWFRCCCFLWSFYVTAMQMYLSNFINLIYFTVWNYTLLTVYFALATWYSLRRLHSDTGGNRYATNLTQRFFLIVYPIVLTMTFFVDAITWEVLFPDSVASHTEYAFLNFSSINMHSINFFMMMVELLLNRLPIKSHHVIYLMLWTAIYAPCGWSYYFLTGKWVYFFLNFETYSCVAWLIGLLVILQLFFSVSLVLYKIKCKFIPTASPSEDIKTITTCACNNDRKINQEMKPSSSSSRSSNTPVKDEVLLVDMNEPLIATTSTNSSV
jgi:hypothetical protein